MHAKCGSYSASKVFDEMWDKHTDVDGDGVGASKAWEIEGGFGDDG